MTDPNVPAARQPGTSADEQYRGDLLSKVGDVRDCLARDFSDEVFAQRLGVARQAADVLVAAIDALFVNDGGHLPNESLRHLGVAATRETRGEIVDDPNVAVVAGTKADAVPGLPDPEEKQVTIADSRDLAEAAPGNMPTDPSVNPHHPANQEGSDA